MTHLPDEVLAALAIGDLDVSEWDRDHASGCPECSADVAALTRVGATLRIADLSAAPDPAPDPALWERIAAATTAPPEGRPRRLTAVAAPTRDSAPSRYPDQAGEPGPPTEHAVVPPGKPRRPRPLRLLAAALVCVLAGLGIGWFAFAPDRGETARLVASTTLRTLDGTQTLGSAQLVDAAGSTDLRVAAAPGPAGSGYVEVWLINDDGKRMVSLGVLDADEAVFAVPPGAIAQGYRIVDLSREAYDDEPRHSGDSIMRGKLA